MFTLYIIFLFSAFIQYFFWGIFFLKVSKKYKVKKSTVEQPTVSVVICVRNEAVHLKKNLLSIFNQQYPNFEIIVIDDDSTDESHRILRELEVQEPRLRVYCIKNKKGVGKKEALRYGILKSQMEWILLTDADCRASTPFWIKKMTQSIDTETEIVLGYGPYRSKNTLVNHWVELETYYTALQYFSFALWKLPYMGVGRNLMYKRSIFIESSQFRGDDDLASGDDDLFIREVANSKNTRINIDKDTFMYSPAVTDFKELYNQKSRHYSTSTRYLVIHQLLLGALSLSHFIFNILCLILVVYSEYYNIIFLYYIGRLGLLFYNYNISMTHLTKKKSFLYLYLFDVLLPVYYLIFAFSVFSPKKKHWN